ncbi:MAG: hypothetical protein ACE5KY_05930, partial [Candidatus Tectimicrobiota bacterium]
MGVALLERLLVAADRPVAGQKHPGEGTERVRLGLGVDDGKVALFEEDLQKGACLFAGPAEEEIL